MRGLVQNVDWLLLLATLAVALVGIWLLRGAVYGIGGLEAAAAKQTVFLAIAVCVLAGTFLVDYRWINRAAMGLYVFNLAALIFVLLSGRSINGAKSWIPLGPINWQPSETMKIATVLVCAQWIALRPDGIESIKGLIPPALICGVPALLVLAQPDLGTASLFFVIFLTMALMAGARRSHLLLTAGAAVVGLASAWPFLKTYQKARLIVFLNPESDPTGAGYNVIQSKIAIGSGGLLGRGWGQGTQSTLRFLPEHHTDFIFASAIEQIGFVGGALLLFGFGFIVWRMISAMDIARDRFGGLVVAGLIAIFAGHIILNVGMNMGLLPVTGIPLPLLSYGGSFLVSTFIIFGLILNVASRKYTFAGL